MEKLNTEPTIAISMLGIGPKDGYQFATYSWEGKTSHQKLIQIALHEFFPREIKEHLVFGTTQAFNRYRKELEDSELPFSFFEIPQGQNEKEFWQMYQIIRKEILDGAELIIDVTHGFRVQPIIMLSVAQYLVNLQKNSIKKVVYGSFSEKADVNPVFDITDYFELNQWSAAVNPAINDNNFKPLKDLLRKKQITFQKTGQHQIKKLIQFGNLVDQLFDNMQANRIRDTLATANLLRAELDELRENIAEDVSLEPLKEIIEELEASIEEIAYDIPKNERKSEHIKLYPITSEEMTKQLRLISFTMRSGNYLQSAEMAVEWMVTLVTHWKKLSVYDKTHRGLTSGFFKEIEEKLKRENSEPLLTEEQKQWKDLAALFKDITELRNDLSHCGWNPSPHGMDKLIKNTEKYCTELQKTGEKYISLVFEEAG